MVRGRAGDQWGWIYAVAPAAFVVVVEGFAWAVNAIADADGPAIAAAYMLLVGAVLAIVAPIEIVRTHQKDALTWCIVSIAVSSIGLGLGFIFYLGAITTSCGSGCFN